MWLWAAAAWAQPAAPSLDQRVNAALAYLNPSTDEAWELTGEEDIVLLRRRRLFTASASITSQYVSNAFLSPDDVKGDVLGVAEVGLTVATRIDGRFNVHVGANVFTARYREFEDLDYDAVVLNLGADASFGTPLGPISLAADYTPTLIYSLGFADRQLTQHRLRMGVQSAWAFGRGRASRETAGFADSVRLIPSLQVERVWADPEDYDNTMGSIDLTLVANPTAHTQIAAGAGYYIRDYDHYFPDVVGVHRRDDGIHGALSLLWAPRPWITASVSVTAVRNWSTSDVNGYDSISVSPNLSARVRF